MYVYSHVRWNGKMMIDERRKERTNIQVRGYVRSGGKGRKGKERNTDILSRHPRPKRLIHILVNLGPHLGRQIAIRIVLVHVEGELCPDAQVDDALVDAVRPVVVDDFDVFCFPTPTPTEQDLFETEDLFVLEK